MTSAIRIPVLSQYFLSLAICAFGNVTTIRGCLMLLVYSDITRCQELLCCTDTSVPYTWWEPSSPKERVYLQLNDRRFLKSVGVDPDGD